MQEHFKNYEAEYRKMYNLPAGNRTLASYLYAKKINLAKMDELVDFTGDPSKKSILDQFGIPHDVNSYQHINMNILKSEMIAIGTVVKCERNRDPYAAFDRTYFIKVEEVLKGSKNLVLDTILIKCGGPCYANYEIGEKSIFLLEKYPIFTSSNPRKNIKEPPHAWAIECREILYKNAYLPSICQQTLRLKNNKVIVNLGPIIGDYEVCTLENFQNRVKTANNINDEESFFERYLNNSDNGGLK